MSGGIFLLRGEDDLVPLYAIDYENESILQQLIARFPDLLTGNHDPAGEQRRWLLIAREPGLPDAEDAGARWAVDHLFLDQHAVPTLVEVKRASDTRIRREVVGQMLDYAANAVVYWPIERLRELFARECERRGRDPDQLVAETAGLDADIEAFWQSAHDNLRTGNLRLVFVADQIPRELRRVIEFLNGQMTATVIGVEVKQYIGGDFTTLVPTVLGQTAEADARKGRPPARSSRRWDEQSFFTTLAETQPQTEVDAARALHNWAANHGWKHSYGSGTLIGSWIPILTTNAGEYRPIGLYTNGTLIISFQPLANRPPFDQPEMRLELLNQLNKIPGVTIAPDAIDRYPTIPLATITAPAGLDQLTRTLEWVEQIAASNHPQKR